jgi:hypothetical protein
MVSSTQANKTESIQTISGKSNFGLHPAQVYCNDYVQILFNANQKQAAMGLLLLLCLLFLLSSSSSFYFVNT